MTHLHAFVGLLADELLKVWQIAGDMLRVLPNMLLQPFAPPLCLSQTVLLELRCTADVVLFV